MHRFVWNLNHLIIEQKAISTNFIMFNTVFSFLANSQSLFLIKMATDEPLKLEVSHEFSLKFHKQIIIDIFEVYNNILDRWVSKHDLSENHADFLIRFLKKSILICSKL